MKNTKLNISCTDADYEVIKLLLPIQFANARIVEDDAITKRVNWNRICIEGYVINSYRARMEEFCQGVIMTLAWTRESQVRPDYRYMYGSHHGDRSQLEAYLGFGSEIVGNEIPFGKGSGAFVVIRTLPQHTEWQAGRLMSGMRGGYQSFDSEAAARREAEINAAYL